MKFSQLSKSTFDYPSQPVFLVHFQSTLVNHVLKNLVNLNSWVVDQISLTSQLVNFLNILGDHALC